MDKLSLDDVLDLSIFTTPVAYNKKAKSRFHKQGARVLHQLASHLGYGVGDYDLRHNQGGIAVSGEIILHSNTLYIQLSQLALGLDQSFMWRTCRGRRDYTGGHNNWMPWERLADLPSVARVMLRAVGRGAQVVATR